MSFTPTSRIPCPCVCHTKDYDVGPRECEHCMAPTSVRVLPLIDLPLGPRDVA